jgi:hypothetical protein
MDCNPTAIAATTKVKLARKALAGDQIEVNSDEHRWSRT